MSILNDLTSNMKKVDVVREIEQTLASQRFIANSFAFANISGSQDGINFAVCAGAKLAASGYKILLVDCNSQFPVLPEKLQTKSTVHALTAIGVDLAAEEKLILNNVNRVSAVDGLYVFSHSSAVDILRRVDHSVESYQHAFRAFKNYFDAVLFILSPNILDEMNIAAMQEADKGAIMVDSAPSTLVNGIALQKFVQTMDIHYSELVVMQTSAAMYDESIIPESMVTVAVVPVGSLVAEYFNSKALPFTGNVPRRDKAYEAALDGFVSHLLHKLGA